MVIVILYRTAAASAVLGIAEKGMREFVAQTRVRQDIYIGGGKRATERMYAAAGAHATHDSNPLQQMHRDIKTTTHHAIFEYDMLAENYGRLAVGLEATHAFI